MHLVLPPRDCNDCGTFYSSQDGGCWINSSHVLQLLEETDPCSNSERSTPVILKVKGSPFPTSCSTRRQDSPNVHLVAESQNMRQGRCAARTTSWAVKPASGGHRLEVSTC